MADVNRTLVNKLVLHHAVTPLWEDRSKAWLAQWFSDNGFARAYGSNPANWSGLINPYTGARSYSQAHFAGQRVTSATPDATAEERAAGYRLVPLVQDPWGQITWHAGNWSVNQSSIGIENLGDYRNYTLREGDCAVIANFWRGRDRELNGATTINLHNEIYSTACPARIAEMRGRIVDLVNTNPVTPQPTPQPTNNVQRYEALPKATYKFIRDANLWNFNFDAQGKLTVARSFKAGDTIEIVGKAIWKNGTSEYYMTEYSFGDAGKTGVANVNAGVNKADLALVHVPVVETKEEKKTEPVAYSTTRVTDANLPKGEEKVTQKGVNGLRTIVYSVTYTDGKETARVVKSDSVTTEAVAEIISVGSFVAPPTTPIEPTEGENAGNWLTRLFAWVLEKLKSFTYKK